MKARDCISPRTVELAAQLLSSLGSVGSTVRQMLLNGAYSEIANLDTCIDDPDSYLASELLSKFPFSTGIDRSQVAIDKFLWTEERIKLADVSRRSLLSWKNNHFQEFHWIFHSMGQKMSRLLSTFSWGECEKFFAFGPGANVGIPRAHSQVHNKFGSLNPTVTATCLDAALS